MSAKVYIGTYQVVIPSTRHSYLFYDPDIDMDNDPTTGTGMQIIRGGAFENYGGPVGGPTVVEV